MINKKNDWFIFGEWHNLYWFHSCYMFGLAFDLKKRSGFGLSSKSTKTKKGQEV